MKGIILAGGTGSRLYPITKAVNKQLVPVYDKPMIYYPLSTLIQTGIKDILIISSPQDLPPIMKLLGDGSFLGINLSYKEQPKPEGIAQAFIIGEEFIGNSPVCLILGDNLFYGAGLGEKLHDAAKLKNSAIIFSYYVKNPERFGVVSFDKNKNAIDIVEKPTNPKSNWAVTGLYFYDSNVVDIAKSLKPSARGELEITDVNNVYLKNKNLKISLLGRGFAWLDTGTPESLLKASNFIKTIEELHGLKIGCIEEIAYYQKFISKQQLEKIIHNLGKNSYSEYLKLVLNEEIYV